MAKAWVGPGGQGVWLVPEAKWEELWKAADWPTRFVNSAERAAKEWAALYPDTPADRTGR